MLASYSLLETQTKERAKALAGEIDTLRQEMAAETVAENTLRIQVGFLQAAGEPSVATPEMQQALSRYLDIGRQPGPSGRPGLR